MSIAGDTSLSQCLDAIASGAGALDRAPRFPGEAVRALSDAGVTALTVPGGDGLSPVAVGAEWATLRAVARADGSVGRILDGHLNAVERIALLAPEPLRSEHLGAVRDGELLLGVWGADPAPAEGEPARLDPGGRSISGAKVFCSGAGGLDAALVLVRGDEPGPPLLAYVDLTEGVEIDRDWYRAAGMRASESHRVVFDSAPLHALLGQPGELGREPWLGRDAIRTAACWAGLVDALREEALKALRNRPDDDQLAALAAGRLRAYGGTVDAWLQRAADRLQYDPAAPTSDFSLELRVAIADAGRASVAEALQALGSRPLASGGRLDRARRDLELFLNQHRLDPLLARLGRRELDR